MKHYVWLGFNPSLKSGNKNRKTAFHVPILNNISDLELARNINKKIYKKVKNKNSFSVYMIESSKETWESLIKENKYFSSIKQPISSIDLFIENLNNIKVNSIDIAKYILLSDNNCTILRLQKLLYLVYLEYLKDYNIPLFDENFYAWKLGPVNKEVYNYFKSKNEDNDKIKYYSLEKDILKQTIDVLENDTQTLSIDDNLDDSFKKISLFSKNDNLIGFILNIVNKYKKYKTNELVNILHDKNSAWYYVWIENKQEYKIIDIELIKKYDIELIKNIKNNFNI